VPALHPGQWTSYDGKTMPWKEWPVAKRMGQMKPRAVIIAVHGLSGAASDFWLLGERLPQAGIPVYAYEVRGQGNDLELAARGDIHHRQQWLDDLRTFHNLVRGRHPGVPIIWYGESLGSLIALHAIDAPGARPDALILASPLAGIRMKISVCERLAIMATSRLLPRLSFSLGTLSGIDENKVQSTSTSTHGGQMAITPHHVASFSLRLIREISQLLSGNAHAAEAATMPVLFLGSPNDVVASPDQVQELFSQVAAKDKQLHWYSRSYHLLLHDVQREQVIRDVTAWSRRRRPVAVFPAATSALSPQASRRAP
jgi:alpha-beta hydrolase superfamily lysophospholipase